jgi:two-component system CheB/CheR fusion protein
MDKPDKSVAISKSPSTPKKRAVSINRTGATSEPKFTDVSDHAFPIVGIGASAGGLEALEQFFAYVPSNSGMAFVVVQHLDPTHSSVIAELLQRTTAMVVMQIKTRIKVKPDHVYVIPPNKDLSILRGTLTLLDPVLPRNKRLVIDTFLTALAQDQHERGIGVILSGMGSDGTLGLRAIKEKGGLALVQEPCSAKFPSMPTSAIEAGLADIIATAEDLPSKLIERTKLPLGGHHPVTASVTLNQKNALDKIFIQLRSHTGHDFSWYKNSMIYRRVERRMHLHQIDKIANYARYLRENSQELDLLFKELLIGVTNFFRDPAVWSSLQEQALLPILSNCTGDKVLRAWVAGCATGEEAYSLAIAFREVLDQIKPQGKITLQIFATDLDADAIDRARQGRYPAQIASDVSADRLSRFFIKEGDSYRVITDVREMVVFAPHNLIMDPPFTKLELITCRNLLIYLDPELQNKLLPLFHYCLNPDGILLLGSAETIGNCTDLFVPLQNQARLYRRADCSARASGVTFPRRMFLKQDTAAEKSKTSLLHAENLQSQAEQLLLQQFSPAAVLVNGGGDILYINGHTGKYLEPAAGKANWNIYAMAREGLRHELALMLSQVRRVKGSLICRDIAIDNQPGRHTVDITVQAIEHPDVLRGMAMIVFTDVATPGPVATRQQGAARGRLAQLERELHLVSEVQRATKEESKLAQEEAQAAKEEAQSNIEELMTSREEMQSLNEELQTVNQELQAKLDELSHEKEDLDNLFNSTNIATIFLDNALHIRRFTSEARQLFRLIPCDVGRPLSDIATDLNYPNLSAAAQEVLRTLVAMDIQIATHDGRWFKVRILPYRTLNNMIAGVLITLVDITTIKTLEMELHRMQIVANVIELRDPGTAGHERWVAGLACAIASELGLDQDRINGLHLGGIVHDIGKVQIPVEVLNKSIRLTEVERQLIKTHAQASYDLLKDIHFPWPIADMVLQHHERLDGSGYPNGLKGEAIMLEARILAVADVVESMSSGSAMRTAPGIAAALAELKMNRGIAYDAAVVDATLKLFRKHKFALNQAVDSATTD